MPITISKRLIASVVVGLVLAVAGFTILRRLPSKQTFHAATSEQSTQLMQVVTAQGRTYNVEVAVTTEEQRLGLANRDDLAETGGMIFPFKPPQLVSFWMKDMRFPLDIVWISNNKVIGVANDLPIPKTGTDVTALPTYHPPAAVDYVLELNRGQAQFFAVGDTLTITTLQLT